VLDCARKLPFDEALCVADSALRDGAVTASELREEAARLRGRGAKQARRVAAYADGRVANPFESVLRAIAIEADSWTWHRDQQTHGRDCGRHTAPAVAGWIVLRFTWEQVMHSPAYVAAVLADVVDTRTAQLA